MPKLLFWPVHAGDQRHVFVDVVEHHAGVGIPVPVDAGGESFWSPRMPTTPSFMIAPRVAGRELPGATTHAHAVGRLTRKKSSIGLTRSKHLRSLR